MSHFLLAISRTFFFVVVITLLPTPLLLRSTAYSQENPTVTPTATDHSHHSDHSHHDHAAHLAATLAQLPVPANLSVRQDDRAAVLQWDFDPANPIRPLPTGVAGYRITWGPASQPEANVRLTQHRRIQLQPLENGQPYVARVQAVDNVGRLAAPSAPITFTGDGTRVEALRTRMNGFFDDFNLPQGGADERKWNTAYSLCNAPEGNGYFINPQFHVHNTIFSRDCDRAQQHNRARALLDFSDNGTRTITFDFDGVFQRNIWYLDLMPNMADIYGPERFPPGGLRFSQNNQMLEIRRFDANGSEVTIAKVDWRAIRPLDWLGVGLVPNVRRTWEIRVSRTSADVFVDGVRAMSAPAGSFNLAPDRFHVHWVTFSYNTPKANQPFVLAHWDNFGFDAPAGSQPTTVTHNYKLTNSGTDAVRATGPNSTTPAQVALAIPDQVTGALARRLMFTLQMRPYDVYRWSASDRVLVNGTAFPVPRPTLATNPPLGENQVVDYKHLFTTIIPLPEGVLQQGQNSISFAFATGATIIHNIHVELDFEAASTPAYTQPERVASGPAVIDSPAIGPEIAITQVGSTRVNTWEDNLNNPAKFNPTVSGVIQITVRANSGMMLEGTGSNAGVRQMELIVNRQIVQTQRTDLQVPAPSSSLTFNLDTRRLPNGRHEIFVRAFAPDCSASINNYGAVGPQAGRYFPLSINVQNGTARTAALESATDAATMVTVEAEGNEPPPATWPTFPVEPATAPTLQQSNDRPFRIMLPLVTVMRFIDGVPTFCTPDGPRVTVAGGHNH